MLIILFGSTVEMGKWSRQYFMDKGFELIHKYNYVPDAFPMQARFGKRRISTYEDVKKCDFIYENNGMIVGFNKEQIIDAVQGQKRCLLTTSTTTIDFIRQIKAAYGDYVTVIGTYIDEHSLQKMFKALPSVTEEELKQRTEIGMQIKKSLLNDRGLFDSIVIYGGEDTLFNFQSLAVQYDYVLDRAEKREKELNDHMYVELPYTGNEDYAFVSYAHADVERVFPILRNLQLAGCRIWYDEGIRGGENWRNIIASKILADSCKNFLLFSSSNSTHSKDIQAEINCAMDHNKKIIRIRLDDSNYAAGTEMYLTGYQHLYVNNASFTKILLDSIDHSIRKTRPNKTGII